MCRNDVYGAPPVHDTKNSLQNQCFRENGNVHEENLILIFRCEPTDEAKSNSDFSKALSKLLTETWEREAKVQFPSVLINRFHIELVTHQNVIIGQKHHEDTIELAKEQI